MKRIIAVLALLAAVLAPAAFGQGVARVVGQNLPSQLNPATSTTSQGGVVTNPSSNFIINVTGGPIVCGSGEIQYINASAFTLPSNSTNLLVYNCVTNNPPLYTKQAVTGPGSNGTSALNQPGNPTSLLYAIPNVEIPIATIVCGSTNCGNTSNGTITDNRTAGYFPIITDWFEFVPATASCAGSVSGNSSGTNGNTVAGGVGVVQDSTSATGTNTHSYWCHIPLPSKVTAGKGVVNILDATFFYGVQTAALGTQVATLASGTLNSVAVFQSTAFPAAAASETASSAYARADTGTAVFTPVVASFNTATTTAGQFYSEKFVAGSTLTLNTDLADLSLVVTLQCSATTATISNTPGFIVHYAFIPF
jgi:hypothetical protein